MELPFKKGDLVRFKYVGDFQFDFEKPYVVTKCVRESSFPSGFRVDLENGEDMWDSSWFELDKASIINRILKEL